MTFTRAKLFYSFQSAENDSFVLCSDEYIYIYVQIKSHSEQSFQLRSTKFKLRNHVLPSKLCKPKDRTANFHSNHVCRND